MPHYIRVIIEFVKPWIEPLFDPMIEPLFVEYLPTFKTKLMVQRLRPEFLKIKVQFRTPNYCDHNESSYIHVSNLTHASHAWLVLSTPYFEG